MSEEGNVPYVQLPSWWERLRRRLDRYYDNPINILQRAGYNQYAWNYYTPKEDIERRQKRLPTTTATKHPLIPLRPLIADKTADDDRDAPYHLRGRDDEFNHLAVRITRQPRGINLVTGPPGVGKTALLAALRAYARQLGYIVIRIPAGALRDRAQLCQLIRQGGVNYRNTGIITAQVDESNLGLAVKGEDILPLDFNAAHKAQTKRNFIGEQQILDHVRDVLANNPQAIGILITVDEMQNILKAGVEPICWDTIATNFTALNDAVLHTEDNLPIATLMAGLPPTRQIYEKALSRPASQATLQLRPVTEEACHQIILDHLNVPDKKGCKPIAFNSQLTAHYAHDCQGHVLHATHAGFVLQKHGLNIQRQNRSQPNDTDLNDISTDMQELRHNRYKKLLTNTTNSTLVNHLIMAAQQVSHHLLHPAVGNHIVQHVLQAQNQKHDSEAIQQALLPLETKGIVQRLEPGIEFLHYAESKTNQPQWEIPTPSTQTYALEHFIVAEQQPEIEQTVQSILQRSLPNANIQSWTKNKTYITQPIPKLPPHNAKRKTSRAKTKPQNNRIATPTNPQHTGTPEQHQSQNHRPASSSPPTTQKHTAP